MSSKEIVQPTLPPICPGYNTYRERTKVGQKAGTKQQVSGDVDKEVLQIQHRILPTLPLISQSSNQLWVKEGP